MTTPQRIDLNPQSLPPPRVALDFHDAPPLVPEALADACGSVFEMRKLDGRVLSLVDDCLRNRRQRPGEVLVAECYPDRASLAIIARDKARATLPLATGYSREGVACLLKTPEGRGRVPLLVIDDDGWAVWYARRSPNA